LSFCQCCHSKYPFDMRVLQLMSFAFVFVIFLFSRFTNHSLYVFLFPLLFFLYFSYLASLPASLLPRYSFYTSPTLLFFLYFSYLASLLASLLPCYSFYTSSTSLLFLYLFYLVFMSCSAVKSLFLCCREL